MRRSSLIISLCIASALTACGGDSDKKPTKSSSSASVVSSVAPSSAAPSSVASSAAASSLAQVLTGVFLDAAVSNLSYSTATLSGTTNANGEFQYRAGEMITFSIGNLVLPAVMAGGVITPLDIVGATSLSDNRVVNLLRLLQSLDADGNAANGIEIPAAAIAAGTQLDFTIAPEVFAAATNVKALLQAAGGVNKELISTEQAVNHFQTTLDTINGSSSSSSVAASSVSSMEESSSSSSSSERVETGWVCPVTGLYFCDDFSGNNTDKWTLQAAAENTTGPNGVFDIADDNNSNYVMRYTAAATGALGGVVALIKPEAFAGVTSADYYVEARIRPRLNSSGTAQRSIYVMARYQDANNWYGMGMIAHETNQPRVEIVKRNSTGSPASTGTMRFNTAITLGTAGSTNGEWYKLRLEMIGTEMKLYLNDLAVATYSDSGLTERGLVGIFTSNRSFEIDDIKVGNANDKPPVPAQLTISPTTSYNAEVGDLPRVITVVAKNKQNANDAFTVESSNPSVVSVSTNGYDVSLSPVGEGSATVTFTSGSDVSLKRTLTASIAPQFVMPTANYNLSGLVSPTANATDVYADTNLTLTFDAPPTMGSAGSIRIFKTSDDSLVDTIKVVEHKDAIGYGILRTLNTRPISISGNTATIALQSKKLEYNTSYYVAVSGSAFTGANLATQPFEGIGKNAGWTFTTKAAPASDLTAITVDDTGTTADFRTVQGALNYVMQNLTKTDAATITVNNGTYNEMLYLRNKDNLTITGESRENVLIQYQNSEGLNPGSAGRPVFLVETADMLTLENLTLKNTTIKTSSGGQAETIYFNSTGRLVAKNANFISEQDTLQLKGYSWFYHTLVAGNVDFIWGNNNVSLFEESEIRSLGDSSGATNGGYVVQARTLSATDKGFVFLNSNLTYGVGQTGNNIPTGATYLARSPGGTGSWDNVVFINSRMDTHINPAGWAGAGVNGQPAPNPTTANATSGWREFSTMDANGNSISLASRVGGYGLSIGEVQNSYCNREQIFAAYNSSAGWNPLPEDTTDCVNFVPSNNSSSVGSSEASSSSSSNTSSGAATSSEASSSSSSAVVVGGSSSSEASSSSSSVDVASCTNFNTVQGFASQGGSTTGGADLGQGNNTVTVSTGTELNNVLLATNATYKDKPLIVYINGTITWANSNNAEIRLRRSNVSIIGMPDSGEFSGVGIRISHGASNIVIRNLRMHEVPQDKGAGDHINLDGQDGAVSNVWIDHNEFYNDLTVDKDFYDELVSGRSVVKNVTISHNYFHDSQKTSLWGSSDNPTEEDVGRTISFHHNHWKDVVSRLPLFRFGEGHLWNNYYTGVTGSAINSRMGAKLRIDNNVFENVKNPILSVDSSTIGYWDATGNSFTGVSWGSTPVAGCTTAPCYAGTSDSVTLAYQPPYTYNAQETSTVKDYVLTNAGRNKINACLNLPEASASSSSSSESSSSSSAAPTVTKSWGYDNAAFAAAGTDLFGAVYAIAADNNIKAAADIDVDGLHFYSTAANVLRYRPAGSANNATALPWWNTNGSFFTSNGELMPAVGQPLVNVRTYIAIPVEAGKAFTVTIAFKQTGSGATAAKVALAGSDNVVLAVTDATYAVTGGSAGSSITFSGDASHQLTSVKLLYGREGLSTGGINITQIDRVQ